MCTYFPVGASFICVRALAPCRTSSTISHLFSLQVSSKRLSGSSVSSTNDIVAQGNSVAFVSRHPLEIASAITHTFVGWCSSSSAIPP